MKTNVLKIKNDMLQRMKIFGYCFIGMIQFVLLGCSCTSTDQEKGLTTIDLSKDYPKKEIPAIIRYVLREDFGMR